MKSAVGEIGFGGVLGSAHGETPRAVDRNRSSGIPAVFRVRANRFDDKVEFVGAVDFTRYPAPQYLLPVLRAPDHVVFQVYTACALAMTVVVVEAYAL